MSHERSIHSDTTPELLRQTHFWHGTGRYQYDSAGNVVDVLEQMAHAGGLVPKRDLWDLSRDMITTSLAHDRNYGRLYADMHLPEPLAAERAVSQTELVEQYIRGVKKEAFLWYFAQNGLINTIKKAREARKRLQIDERWSKKINKAEPSIAKSFVVGSDIPNNYPILLGIREVANEEPIAPYLAKHETRTSAPIPFALFSHIEVPDYAITETEALLTKYNVHLPILAIEDVEKLVHETAE